MEFILGIFSQPKDERCNLLPVFGAKHLASYDGVFSLWVLKMYADDIG